MFAGRLKGVEEGVQVAYAVARHVDARRVGPAVVEEFAFLFRFERVHAQLHQFFRGERVLGYGVRRDFFFLGLEHLCQRGEAQLHSAHGDSFLWKEVGHEGQQADDGEDKANDVSDFHLVVFCVCNKTGAKLRIIAGIIEQNQLIGILFETKVKDAAGPEPCGRIFRGKV